MLSDIERKMLRIIFNFSLMNKRTPTLKELMIKTGRNRGGVMYVLQQLNEKQYIKWDHQDPENIQLLEAWERKWMY
jgi:DNA-binding IclR family transcriptional regulator